jgi:hypothetical protein
MSILVLFLGACLVVALFATRWLPPATGDFQVGPGARKVLWDVSQNLEPILYAEPIEFRAREIPLRPAVESLLYLKEECDKSDEQDKSKLRVRIGLTILIAVYFIFTVVMPGTSAIDRQAAAGFLGAAIGYWFR